MLEAGPKPATGCDVRWRSSQNGLPENANERREDFVQRNSPTHAKTGLEWATRRYDLRRAARMHKLFVHRTLVIWEHEVTGFMLGTCVLPPHRCCFSCSFSRSPHTPGQSRLPQLAFPTETSRRLIPRPSRPRLAVYRSRGRSRPGACRPDSGSRPRATRALRLSQAFRRSRAIIRSA